MLRIVFLAFALLLTGVNASAGEAGTALVTGANRGIGLELARQLDATGYTVIGTARNPAKATELKALGVRVEQLDVTDPASVAALAKTLNGVSIDVLVNNAGVGGQGGAQLADIDFEEMARTFNVNSIGPIRVTQALVENLRGAADAKVVHISSIMGSIAGNQGGYYDYRASKAALNMLNKSLAQELGKLDITCVVLHPGWVQTRMGGAGAPVKPRESAAGLVKVIAGLDADDNGRFYDYQGKELPW